MIRPFLPVALVLATLALSGCVVGDSVAHLVKLGAESQSKSADDPAPAAPTTTPNATPARQEEPPLPSVPAAGGAIQVESLPPPKP